MFINIHNIKKYIITFYGLKMSDLQMQVEKFSHLFRYLN